MSYKLHLHIVEAGLFPHGADFESSEHPGGAEPSSGEVEEGEESVEHAVAGAFPPVGDAEGDVHAFGPPRAEDGLDVGRVFLDIGRHDHYVARRQRSIGIEHVEEPVVEHLDLACGSVADMDPDRSVVV